MVNDDSRLYCGLFVLCDIVGEAASRLFSRRPFSKNVTLCGECNQ